jgi:hypothetical protein
MNPSENSRRPTREPNHAYSKRHRFIHLAQYDGGSVVKYTQAMGNMHVIMLQLNKHFPENRCLVVILRNGMSE